MYSEEAKLDEGLLDKLRASDRVQLRKFRRYGARQELEWHVRGKTFLATRVAPPENVGEAIFVYQQSGELLPTSRDLLEFAVDRVNFSQSFAPVGAGLDALVEAQLRPLTEQETTSDLEKNCSLENLRTMAWALMPLEISSVGIRAIQHDLTILGHYNGLVDGKLGPSTVAAIKSFQTEMNFEVDGQVSESQRLELRQRAAIERCRYKWTQYISDSERYKLFYPAAVFTEAAAMSNGKLELKSALVPKHALRVHVIHDSTRGQFESKFDQLSASAATSLPEFDFPLNRYVKKESSWFVVNGVRKASSLGAEYFYARYERADNGRIIGYEISVPFGQREKYKTIILAIAQSFEILK